MEAKSDSRLLSRVQAASSDDEEVFDLARAWLQSCIAHHISCRATTAEQLERPSRLLQLHSQRRDATDTVAIKLVSGTESIDPFVALSYCWGDQGSQSLVLGETTESQLRSGVSLAELPLTLRDAATTTIRLGYHYLWIDALCIRQYDKEDWAKEAGRMRDVYRNAAVTIEAASSSSTAEGFLKARTPAVLYCTLPWSDGKQGSHVLLRPVQSLLEEELYGTKLYSRGWTLQERILARRTLSFGTQQLTFECANGTMQETRLLSQPTTQTKGRYLSKAVLRAIQHRGPWYSRVLPLLFRLLGLHSGSTIALFTMRVALPDVEPRILVDESNTLSGTFAQTSRGLWYQLANLYSVRALSNYGDRLPAISGLAAEFSKYLDDSYVAGMWKRDFPFILGWLATNLYRKELSDPSLSRHAPLIAEHELIGDWPYGVRRNLDSGIPSWSWASVRGMVRFTSFPIDGRVLLNHRALATVLHIETQPKFADPFGQLSTAYIDLKVPFLPIPDPRVYKEPPKDCSCPLLLAIVYRQCAEYDKSRAGEFYQQHHYHDKQTFALIKLFTWDTHANAFNQKGLLDHLQRTHFQMVGLLLLESTTNGSYRRLGFMNENHARTEEDCTAWAYSEDYRLQPLNTPPDFHDPDERKMYDERMGQMRREGEADLQENIKLAAELHSPLWELKRIRLI